MILFSHKAKWLWGLALMVQKWFVVVCVCICQCFSVRCFNEAYSQFPGKVNTFISTPPRVVLTVSPLAATDTLSLDFELQILHWEGVRANQMGACFNTPSPFSLSWQSPLKSMHSFCAEIIFKTLFYAVNRYHPNSFSHNPRWRPNSWLRLHYLAQMSIIFNLLLN